MKELLLVGIGAGDPDYITYQAIKALRRSDVIFLMDKGAAKHKLNALRREICARFLDGHTPRFAEGLRRAITDALAPVLAVGFYFRPVPWSVIRFHADMIKQTKLPTYAGFFDDLLEHSELGAADVLAGMPGYILVGDRDRVTPVSQSRRLWDIWPRAFVQVLPESGHMPPLDAPGAVTAAIERLLAQL